MKSKSKTRQKTKDTSEVIALRKSIGERIRAAREDRGFTQEQLAERANLTAGGRVSDYERGQYRIGLEVFAEDCAKACTDNNKDIITKIGKGFNIQGLPTN